MKVYLLATLLLFVLISTTYALQKQSPHRQQRRQSTHDFNEDDEDGNTTDEAAEILAETEERMKKQKQSSRQKKRLEELKKKKMSPRRRSPTSDDDEDFWDSDVDEVGERMAKHGHAGGANPNPGGLGHLINVRLREKAKHIRFAEEIAVALRGKLMNLGISASVGVPSVETILFQVRLYEDARHAIEFLEAQPEVKSATNPRFPQGMKDPRTADAEAAANVDPLEKIFGRKQHDHNHGKRHNRHGKPRHGRNEL